MSDRVIPARLPEPRASKPQYLASVEWLRVAACLGIVAFHVGTPLRQAALGGLQAFTALTVAFGLRSAWNRPFREFARTRLNTLGVPWLAWSAFFACLLVVQALRHHEPPFAWWKPSMWFIGPVTHLWFLPFALLVSLLLGMTLKRPPGWGSLVALFATVAVSCLLIDVVRRPMPLPQWLSVLPAVAAGVYLATIAPGSVAGRRPIALVGGALVLVELAFMVTGYAEAALPQLVGLGLTFAAWTLSTPASDRVLAVSRLSFGVYFVHPFFHVFLERAAPEVHVVVRWLLASAGSFLLVALLRKTPVRRVL